MRSQLRITLGLAALSATLQLGFAADATAGYVDFGKFSPAAGNEFVEVNLKSNLISMVARLAQKEEPEVATLLRGLQAVRVNVIGLNDANRADVEQRVKTVRGELEAQGWERIVTAQKSEEDVGIYLKTRGEEMVEGLVVTVIEGKREAVLVNIVGQIKPEQLAVVGERLHLEPLKQLGQKVDHR